MRYSLLEININLIDEHIIDLIKIESEFGYESSLFQVGYYQNEFYFDLMFASYFIRKYKNWKGE